MIVWQSTYDALQRRHEALKEELVDYMDEYAKLKDRWNKLVNRINAHGGEAIFDRPKAQEKPRQKRAATKKDIKGLDIKKLLMLCHPDKHGNSEVATEVTRKLLELRSKA